MSGRWPIKTYIAGLSYYNTSQIREGPVQLEREPTNKHDPNAIKVIQSGIHIGYVPKNMTFYLREGCIATIRPATFMDGPTLYQREWVLTVSHPEFSISDLLRKIYSEIHT